MGLDNGIVLKNYKKHHIPEYIIDLCPFDCMDEKTEELDLCYWRKYWSLRNEIVQRIHLYKPGDVEDDGNMKLDPEDVDAIRKVLINYLDRKYWEDGHDDCIWDYDEAKGNILNSIIILIWLADYMKLSKEEPVEVYFYDSY